MKPIVSERENLVFRHIRRRCENRNATAPASGGALPLSPLRFALVYQSHQLCKRFHPKANANGTRCQFAAPRKEHSRIPYLTDCNCMG